MGKKTVSTAKYMEIAQVLRQEILLGKYDSSGRIPSEMQIVRRFHVSRSTTVRVMIELQKAGLIERLRGSGTMLSHEARNATGLCGLVIPGSQTVEIMGPISSAIAGAVKTAGYTLLTNSISGADDYERAVQALRVAEYYAQQHVSCVFVEPIEMLPNSYGLTHQILSVFDTVHIPVILLDRDICAFPERSQYDLVGINNMRAGYLIGDHLVASGACRIGFFMHRDSAATIIARSRGVMAAATAAGLRMSAADICAADPEDLESVRTFMNRRKPDAIVCGNDLTAARLMQTLRKLKVSVPDDVLVAGFDDVHSARLVTPQLTTYRQPCKEIGQVAVELMLRRLRWREAPVCSTFLSGELIVRESTTRLQPSTKKKVRK